eukprot:g62816.t1
MEPPNDHACIEAPTAQDLAPGGEAQLGVWLHLQSRMGGNPSTAKAPPLSNASEAAKFRTAYQIKFELERVTVQSVHEFFKVLAEAPEDQKAPIKTQRTRSRTGEAGDYVIFNGSKEGTSLEPKLLEDVLGNIDFRISFLRFLEEYMLEENLAFLVAVDLFLQVDAKDEVKQSILKEIVRKFISSNSVTVPAEVQAGVEEELRKGSVQTDILKNAYVAVELFLSQQLDAWMKSDEYAELFDVILEDQARNFNAVERAGYKAVRVELHRTPHIYSHTAQEVGTVSAELSMGESFFRTNAAKYSKKDCSHLFKGALCEFNLQQSLQVTICVFRGKKNTRESLIGECILSLADMQTDEENAKPLWYQLTCDWKATGEILLTASLLRHPAAKKLLKKLETKSARNGSISLKIKNKVSKKKKRYQEGGFDLDLSYISANIIAMGYPAEGSAGVYRNHLKDVQRFFNTLHPEHYLVMNLCSEQDYDASKFGGRKLYFPFDDHNPCPFPLIEEFCIEAQNFLSQSAQNCLAVHCKAGKGRTGTLISCLLQHLKMQSSAHEALQYFAEKRTKNQKGVTIPSQIRYVHYYEIFLQKRRAAGSDALLDELVPLKWLSLDKIRLHGIPKMLESEEVQMWFTIECEDKGSVVTVDSKKAVECVRFDDPATNALVFNTRGKLPTLFEDVRVTFYRSTKMGSKKMFVCWFNTRFLALDEKIDNQTLSSGQCRLVLPKNQIDKALKDKKHKLYSADMSLEFLFKHESPVERYCRHCHHPLRGPPHYFRGLPYHFICAGAVQSSGNIGIYAPKEKRDSSLIVSAPNMPEFLQGATLIARPSPHQPKRSINLTSNSQPSTLPSIEERRNLITVNANYSPSSSPIPSPINNLTVASTSSVSAAIFASDSPSSTLHFPMDSSSSSTSFST